MFGCKNVLTLRNLHVPLGQIMHKSIPAVPSVPPPPPRPGNSGAFAHVVSPGGGASAILSRPGGWAFAYPGATPRAFDTRV